MSVSKVTWKFNYFRYDPNTGRTNAPATRSAGWSEQWFSNLGFDSTALDALIHQWARLRAACMTVAGSIVGYSVHEVDPTGRTYSRRKLFAGNRLGDADIPEVCLVGQFTTDSNASREVCLRGLVDNDTKRGEYVHSEVMDDAVRAFMAHVSANWYVRAKTHVAPFVQIDSIDAAGLATTKEAHGLVAPEYVQLYRLNTPEMRQYGVPSIEATRVNDLQFQVDASKCRILPTTGGQLRFNEGMELSSIILRDPFERMVIGKRDTGAPFFQSRGRQSARRG